ncbi:LysR family transcriptional regulator [Caballeronia sp. LZ008]|jgi:DNA-binding transcriptional LysR family regulator|uniref:LysR family transcriptional regulator n=1 Tax=unclassified Caballeronia TaxID=2646786 RepID=UPI002028422A|nr:MULTISPECIES: LysR family transcriptional regulator [unclassified Caballeronia]MDR5766659.1 LysR family transcriptional regulator [Caballeronia sp. LZ028]MDR5794830.1 LysR family transcriptional regulator [Caballeronia sp. LZ008]
MDLSALNIFRAVVRENGVTRAAAKLNRVQSNVTTRIRQLEETLGTDLFIRDGRRLVLTPAGETLLPYAERLLALAEEARHAVSEDRPQGRLRLGTMESTAASRLPRVLAAYHQRWPQVTLELTTGVTRALIDSVRAFEVDAAVMARPIEPDTLPAEQFESVPVFEEELTLVTPRGQHPSTMAQASAGLTLIAFERGCAYRSYATRWYEQQGIRPARVLELGSYHAIVACVAAGAGVAVAPRSVLELARLDDEVDLHPMGEFGRIDTLLVWRKGHFSAALNAMRELLAERPDDAKAA